MSLTRRIQNSRIAYFVAFQIFRLVWPGSFNNYAEAVPTAVAVTVAQEVNQTSEDSPSNSSSECSNNNGWQVGRSSKDPDRFSKLKLNVNELLGSRWAIDQKDAITVSHSIDITDATLIHNNQLTMRVEFNLRQSWSAPGLEFPPGLFKDDDPPGTFLSADDKVLKHMWSPDSYISTARESNMNTVGTPLSLVYIFKNRTIIFKVRMFTKIGCTSSFQWYPHDVQSCTLMIESYKYHDNIALYHWTDEKLYRPVVHRIRRLFQYDLRKPLKYENGTIERGGRGKRYAYVRVKFTFERKLGNNMIQVYTPTVLVVFLSWFSFWLGLDAIPGRISLLVTCMLTLVTMHSGIKSHIPPVHYITMMDVWMVCCMAMVFSAMCEFVLVKYAHWRLQQKQKATDKMKEMENRDALVNFIQQVQVQVFGDNMLKSGGKEEVMERISRMAWTRLENGVNSVMADQSCRKGSNEKKIESKGSNLVIDMTGAEKVEENGESNNKVKDENPWWMKVDKVCRGLFPLIFCIFNGVYWPVLLYDGVEIQDDRSYHHS